MDVTFKEKKLAKMANEFSKLQKAYGELARKIRQRLDELDAADTLADVSRLPPPRCHQLGGDRHEQFSVDVSRNYRLVFEVANEPIPRQESDGGIDLHKVTAVRVLEIIDTHE